MKFCSNCGKQMNDNERFCPACGTDSAAGQPQPQVQPQPQPAAQPVYTYAAQPGQQPVQNNVQNPYGQPVYATANQAPAKAPSKLNKKLPLFAAGAVVVALLLVFFFRSVVGSGSITMKGAVKAYSNAIEAQSGKKMLNATMSRPLLKAAMESGDMTKKEVIEELDSVYDDSDITIKIKNVRITDKEKMDKDDVKDLNTTIKDKTDVNPHIKKVYQVEVKYQQRYKYSGEDWTDWEKKTDTIYVYKSNGNWYVLPSSIL